MIEEEQGKSGQLSNHVIISLEVSTGCFMLSAQKCAVVKYQFYNKRKFYCKKFNPYELLAIKLANIPDDNRKLKDNKNKLKPMKRDLE